VSRRTPKVAKPVGGEKLKDAIGHGGSAGEAAPAARDFTATQLNATGSSGECRITRLTVMKIDGRCHCGYVTFEAEADPETTTLCNCTDCQTMSGAPLRAVVMTRLGTFKLLSGKPTEYRKTADSGNVRLQGFCPQCGTALYSTSIGDEPNVYNVRVGVVRQRDQLVPRRQIFVRSQQGWINDLSSISKFDAMPH